MALMFRSVLQNAGGAAALVVTCDSEFAGATISCSDGTTTLNKTCPSSSPYEVTFKIPNSGDWTVSATVSGTTYTSDTITVELDYSTGLSFGFNWQTWVDTAQYLDSTDYSTLSDLLADEEALRELCLEHACVDYLCDGATVTADLATVISDNYFAKWANNSDYALDNMIANAAIKTAMDTAGKYGYGEWTLQPQVPTMTSNTAPYGEASADKYYSANGLPYYAFDGNDSTAWSTYQQTNPTNGKIRYAFTNPVCVKKVTVLVPYDGDYRAKNYKINASNDGAVYTTITSGIFTQKSQSTLEAIDLSVNSDSYVYWELEIDDTYNNYAVMISSLQFYAWGPKGNVPIMTSNTAPYGEVVYSSQYNPSSYPLWKVFDNDDNTYGLWTNAVGGYCGYKSTNPICVKKAVVRITNDMATAYTDTFKIQGSNTGDSNDWHDISGGEFTLAIGKKEYEINLTNDSYYLYHRAYQTTKNTSESGMAFATLQFYGRELSVSVPKMDTNTTPYGEASANVSSTNAYKAFDNTSTIWQGTTYNDGRSDSTSQGEIQYKFTSPVCIKALYLIGFSDALGYDTIKNSAIEGSNDGVAFTPIASFEDFSYGTSVYPFFFSNNNSYLYYKFKGTWFLPSGHGASYRPIIGDIQFYGLDYSEKEFEEGTNKKWLYDHGLELETFENLGSGAIIRESSQIGYNKTVTGDNGIITVNAVDLTDYDLVRAKVGSVITAAGNEIAVTGFTAYKVFTTNDMPNTYGFSISSINESKKILATPNASAGLGKFTISELWLE